MQIWQKIKIPLLIAIFFIGLAFVVFAIFFNRATLSVNSQAPYSISIDNLRSVNCPEDHCQATVAPGTYQITLTKADYQPIKDPIQLSIGQTLEKSYSFQLIPKIQPLSDWNSKKDFAQNPYLLEQLMRVDLTKPSTFWQTFDNSLLKYPTATNFQIATTGDNYLLDNGHVIGLIQTAESTPDITPIPTGSPFFYTDDNSQALYLANDPDTLKQNLYSLDLTKRPLTTTSLTTFLRAITSYQLIPNKNFTAIAALDQSASDQVGLYLIDLSTKTKKLLASEPNIMAFRWLERDFLNDNAAPPASPENQFFLLQKRNPVTLRTELYRLSLNDPTPELLTINNNLSTILPISDHQVIYAQTDGSNGFNFQQIDLNTAQSTTLFAAQNLTLPSKIQYDASQNKLLFLSGSTIYSLTLTL